MVGWSRIQLHTFSPVRASKRRGFDAVPEPAPAPNKGCCETRRTDQKWLSRSIPAFVVLASLVDATPCPVQFKFTFAAVALLNIATPSSQSARHADNRIPAHPPGDDVLLPSLLFPGCPAARTMEAPGKLAASAVTVWYRAIDQQPSCSRESRLDRGRGSCPTIARLGSTMAVLCTLSSSPSSLSVVGTGGPRPCFATRAKPPRCAEFLGIVLSANLHSHPTRPHSRTQGPLLRALGLAVSHLSV